LVQPDSDGRRGQRLAKIQEFDLELKPMKLVKGQGLAKLLAESNFKALGMNHLQAYEELPYIDEFDVTITTTEIQEKISSFVWYSDIVSYLLTLQCLSDITPSKERTLKLHAVKYFIVERQLYWKYPWDFY
jgi:hypothetical protein